MEQKSPQGLAITPTPVPVDGFRRQELRKWLWIILLSSAVAQETAQNGCTVNVDWKNAYMVAYMQSKQ